MARISPTRGQKLIFILYILLGVGILYLDIISNNFQSVKNGFKSFKISSSYFLNQITIEQIKKLAERSKSKKFLIKENEMLKEALDLSYLNNYLISKENNFYKDHEIIKYAAQDKNYQSSYKIAQLRKQGKRVICKLQDQHGNASSMNCDRILEKENQHWIVKKLN